MRSKYRARTVSRPAFYVAAAFVALIAIQVSGICVALASEQTPSYWSPAVIDLKVNRRTTLIGARAELRGNLAHLKIKRVASTSNVVYGFMSSDDVMTWTVRAAIAGDYQMAVLYSGDRDVLPQCEMEIRSGDAVRTLTLGPAQQPEGPGRLRYRRHELDQPLSLKQGVNHISLRLVQIPDAQIESAQKMLKQQRSKVSRDTFRIFSIELTPASALDGIRQRATALRSDMSWMIEGKYGLFSHWSPLTYPLEGDTRASQNYEWGVNHFDVDAYVDMVRQTGAAWVIFTTTHGRCYWPGPSKVLDGILPGRTCKRDLIMELADALGKYNIRLMLYYHHGRGDDEWMKASGMLDPDLHRWYDNVVALHKEISERYGTKLWGSGAYVDGSFNLFYQCDFPFERLARAMKSGNPQALVGYSVNSGPNITPFSDYFVQDGGDALVPKLPDAWYQPGGAYEGLRPAWFFYMDAWVPRGPYNGTIRQDPIYTTQRYIDYFKKMAEAKIPVTVNLVMTQDVTREHPFVNPKSLAIMQEVRKAIRGK